MTIKDQRKQLLIGKEKYLISNSFYSFLIAETNKICEYKTAKIFVRIQLNKALKNEVEEVKEFKRNKIDFEI